MRLLSRNSIHEKDRSYDVSIFSTPRMSGAVKITYEAYNAAEKFTGETWDGHKWNNIFNIWDLGVIPNSSAYNIWPPEDRKRRCENLLLSKATEYIKQIF